MANDLEDTKAALAAMYSFLNGLLIGKIIGIASGDPLLLGRALNEAQGALRSAVMQPSEQHLMRKHEALVQCELLKNAIGQLIRFSSLPQTEPNNKLLLEFESEIHDLALIIAHLLSDDLDPLFPTASK